MWPTCNSLPYCTILDRPALSTSAFLFRDSFRDCYRGLCQLFIYACAHLAKISNGARSTNTTKLVKSINWKGFDLDEITSHVAKLSTISS